MPDCISIGLQTRWGGGKRNPSLEDLKNAIKELDEKDDEHPCAFVTDDDGYIIEVYQDGKALFYHLDVPGNIKEKKLMNPDEALKLWLLLDEGNVEKLEAIFSK